MKQLKQNLSKLIGLPFGFPFVLLLNLHKVLRTPPRLSLQVERVNFLLLSLVIVTFSLVSCAAYQRAPKLEDLLKEAQLTDEEAATGVPVKKPSIPMESVPYVAGIYFPMKTDDTGSGSINHRFSIAQTEVTYKLWYKVKSWATPKGYTFANQGREGNKGTVSDPPKKNEPVVSISWRDVIVWCNAYTEWYNATKNPSTPLTVVYKSTNNAALRDATAITDVDSLTFNPTSNTATGFRLPTSAEWEFAARLRTDTTNCVISGGECNRLTINGTTYYFTKGNSASGASADYNNTTETDKVAWYHTSKTHDVATKTANALGIYDMSGNVSEWCFDTSGSARVNRGGNRGGGNQLQVGDVSSNLPDFQNSYIGFRVARSLP